MRIQRLFKKNSRTAWNVEKISLTVGRRSRDLRPLSRDRSATFFQKISELLETSKNVIWQSADGRVTSDHCRVTVRRLFSKFFRIAWNVKKALSYSRPTVAWPPTTVAWPFSDIFRNNPGLLETSKKPLFDSRPTVAWPPTTVAWPFSDFFSKNFRIVWNVKKTLFGNQPTVAWPPTTVAWPFGDFFQKFSELLETSKKRSFTVGRRSRDLRPLSRDRWVIFFKMIRNCLKRLKNVVWQSADGRVLSDNCRVNVQYFFSRNFQIAWSVQERCLTVGRRSRDLRPLSRDCSVTFFKKILNCLKRPKTFIDSRSTVAWPPTTSAWPFSDLFQKFCELLETSEKRCLKVSGRSRDCPATLLQFSSYGFTYASVCCLSRFYSFFPTNSSATYLLLQEWSHPGNFDIISKLGIGRREFLILAGKFQLVDSLWGKQVPHYKHKRRSTTYLLREIPVKNRDSWGRGVNTRENCRVKCNAVQMQSPSKCNVVFGLGTSVG